MTVITTSIFELFKIGPGPSSSHTIGPMRAGFDFRETVKTMKFEDRPDKLEISLYGSLSATGKGHGTDRAVIAGLLGNLPDNVSCDFLDSLADAKPRPFPAGEGSIDISIDDIVYGAVENDFPFSNTMIIRISSAGKALFEREYYSVGGGFIQWKGQPADVRGEPACPYRNMAEMKKILTSTGMRLHELIIKNETAITGIEQPEILERIDHIIEVMKTAVRNGLSASGVLPGPIGLHRKASNIFSKIPLVPGEGQVLIRLDAYAFAASEENAAGRIVVTAPTSGSAGVIPSVIFALEEDLGVERERIREGMMAAAAVGFLAKHNASISGAEVGCQGEIGVASAMAAALITYAKGYRFGVTENAAESALEHHLGMTCDPVGGYVQIPCIERNAMGAVKAYNAYLIATVGNQSFHMVDLDKVIRAMAETGRDMSKKYKETSEGGLALSVPEC